MHGIDEDTNQSYQIHLKITDLLDLNEVQMIMLKLWFNSLVYFLRLKSTFGVDVKAHSRIKSQANIIRPLTPNSRQLLNITFQNCQEQKMDITYYQDLLARYIILFQQNIIIHAIAQSKFIVPNHNTINQNPTVPRNNIRNVLSSFTLNVWFKYSINKWYKRSQMEDQQTGTLLRRIFIAITTFTNKGKINLKELNDIKSVEVGDIIRKEERLISLNIESKNSKYETEEKQQAQSIPNESEQYSSPLEYIRAQASLQQDILYNRQRAKSFRLQKQHLVSIHRSKLDQNNSFSQNYPVDDVLKIRKQATISAYAYQGYDITDQTQSINKLHKQLLKKITLNR